MILWLTLWSSGVSADSPGSVTVRGVATHTGSGELRVELLLVDEEGGAPLLVQASTLRAAGPFALRAPAGLGVARVRVAHDSDGDGVGAGDAQGLSEPLMIGVTDIEGVEITLRRPDLAPQR